MTCDFNLMFTATDYSFLFTFYILFLLYEIISMCLHINVFVCILPGK